MFVVKEVFTGVTTQGETIEEAVELYLEEMPELGEELEKKDIGVLNVYQDC